MTKTSIRRATAVGAAAVLLLTGTVPPVAAQAQPSSNAAKPKSNAVPPPLPPGFQPPPDVVKPDVEYKRNDVGCITSNTQDNLIEYKPWGQNYLNLQEAHRFATGKGVTIAVIDTGVEPINPRLKGRVTGGGDYVGAGAENGDGLKDCDGHGTEVAGVAAASKGEGDFVGAAPGASILAIRQTSDRFKFESATEKRASAGKVITLAQAIVHAANKGAKVINISLTNCFSPKSELSNDDRLLQAAIKYAVDQMNVVIVTAAGNISTGENAVGCTAQNDNPDPNNVNFISSPAWFSEDVLSVASMRKDGAVSDFSVWGPWVSIAGPGEEIISVDPKGPGLTNANTNAKGESQLIKGTSFASPYVAGVAALVREKFPQLKAREVMDRLKKTAMNPGNPGGRDHKIGYGMVNPVAALTAVIPAEAGVKDEQPKQLATTANPPPPTNWPPIIVALSGVGTGFALLMLTLFVRNSLNRRRGTA